ncbi:MAG: DUF5666 domain-containing protein [Candidatus Manganitrophaceae bacterium]
MRKGLSLIFSLSVVGLLTTTPLFADEMVGEMKGAPEKHAASAKAGMKKAKGMAVKGEVAEVDAAGNSLTIKEKEKEMTISVTEKTIITAGKTKKSLADLKAGDKVVVKVAEVDGKTVAQSIRVAVGKK